MKLPKFLIADNSSINDALFIIHTEYPRFALNAYNDYIYWLEEFDNDDEIILETELELLIDDAFAFYDSEMKSLD
jgi:hypothetical protein